ncbi:MAG: metallopeptidase family protein [Candidatus Saccharimonadales bacterium]
MIQLSDERFEVLVRGAVADIPERFASHLENIAFRVDDAPSREQLAAGGLLHGHATLLGLYVGVPLPQRGGGYTGMVPDVITVFKRPHEVISSSYEELAEMVHQTVWHEVAHYFGLDHGQIHALEAK